MNVPIDEYVESLRHEAARQGMDLAEIVAPEDRQVILGDHRCHYLDWDNSETPDVVLLHGWALTAHTWDLVCLSLRSTFHCLALDLRGHGDSEWSPVMDYSLDAHCRDVTAFIDEVAKKPVVLIGMSLGGLVAALVAARNPSWISELVIVDAGPRPALAETSPSRSTGSARIASFTAGGDALDSIDEFVERAIEFNPRRDRRTLRTTLQHNLRQQPDGKWTWRYDRRNLSLDATPRGRDMRTMVWDEIASISSPTLLIRGAESDDLSKEDAARFHEELTDGHFAEIPGAGHSVQGDNPLGFLNALNEFLNRSTSEVDSPGRTGPSSSSV